MNDYKIPMQRVMSWQISFLKKVQNGSIAVEKTLNDNQKIVIKNGYVSHSVDGVFAITELGVARIAELIEWKKYLGSTEDEAPKWPWSFEKPLLLRPSEVLSRIPNPPILEIAHNALRVLFKHRHMLSSRSA